MLILESEIQTSHKASGSWVRTVVVSRSEGTTGIIDIVTLITCEGEEVLSRNIYTYTSYVVGEPLVRQVAAKLYVSNLPVSGILNLAAAEQVVPSQGCTVREVSTGDV
jgi:hypothetical protein